jgi:hypothetical protein
MTPRKYNDPNWTLRTPRQSRYSGPYYVRAKRDRTGACVIVALFTVVILSVLTAWILS